ncbi:MAG: hypothetical protein P8R42_22990 [Candidatus Binatia bacterium]|nr:hypothetical protein [Candidatus Binatia bacterium]
MRFRPIESWEITAGRLAVEAFVVAALCVAFLWPFRLYGFDLVDEGTQLVQIERVAAGERPYLDFETGYTPGYFALEAWLLDAGGGSIVAIRTFGLLVQGVVAGSLWAIARAWAGLHLAASIVLLYVAFLLPVSLRLGAPFNIPYPGWLAALPALGAQVMVARVSARRIRRRNLVLLLTGVAAGLAFSVKPNSGLLILAGSALALVPTWSPERRLNRILSMALRVTAIVATVILVAPGLFQGYAVGLLLPMAVAVFRTRPSFDDGDDGLRHLLVLTGGFSLVVLPWLGPLTMELGIGGMLRDVLLLDGGVIEAYLLPFATPSWGTLVLGAGGLAAFFSRDRPRLLPTVVLGSLVLATLVSIPMGPRLAAENALLWLGPMVVLFGLMDGDALERWPRERAVLVFLSIYSLQLFPRPDSIHVAMGGPPIALGAALLWRRFERRWRSTIEEDGVAMRWAPRVALALVAVLAIGRAAPALIPRVTEAVVAPALGPRAPITILARHAHRYATTADLVREVGARGAEGDAIFAFPDVAGVGFLAERAQPYRYLYFVPGRPDRAGEEEMIRRLAEVSPSLVVTCPPHVEAFAGAPEYFSRLGEEFERAYDPVAEVGGCVLRSRRVG